LARLREWPSAAGSARAPARRPAGPFPRPGRNGRAELTDVSRPPRASLRRPPRCVATDFLEFDDGSAHDPAPQREAERREDGTVRRARDVRDEVDAIEAAPGAGGLDREEG